jgi:hypothetical protein
MRYFPLALLFLGGSTAAAQVSDQGTLTIRKSGREIGREEYVIQSGREGGAAGTTIVSRARIPAVTPQFTQEATLERRADGSFASMQISRRAQGDSTKVLAEAARNVLRIHTSSAGAEAIREYPTSGEMIGLADSAFALFAAAVDLATDEGRSLIGVFPITGRRVAFTVQRVAGNPPNETRILLAGEIAGTIWLDESGHLKRMEFPASDIEIVRLRR